MRKKKLELKKTYYFVPPCPKCDSYCTGRYVPRPFFDADEVEEQSLKHGEIVRFVRRVPEKNAFCVDCGNEWTTLVRTKFLTDAEMEKEIERRGTRDAYLEIKALNDARKLKKKRNPVLRIFNIFLLRG